MASKLIQGRRPRPMIGAKLKPVRRIAHANLEPRRIYTVTAVDVPNIDGEPLDDAQRLGEGWWWVQTDRGGDEWYAYCNFKEA